MEKVTFALDWKKTQRLEIWFGGISSSEVIWGKVLPLSKLECPYLLKQTEQNQPNRVVMRLCALIFIHGIKKVLNKSCYSSLA